MDCDVLIAGGGMTGSALALALADSPLRTMVVEAQTGPGANNDDRSLTLSHSSRRLFEGLGTWDALAGCGPAAIHEIQVSDSSAGTGTVHLRAPDLGVDALGYVFENRCIAATLTQQLQHKGVPLMAPARVAGYTDCGTHLQVSVEREGVTEQIDCRLLVASDGTGSSVRTLARIPVRTIDYGQTAIVARIRPEHPSSHIAFERFTPAGPIAILPRSGGATGLVLSVSSPDAAELLAAPGEILALVQKRFGARLGRFLELGPPHGFPLRQVRAAAMTAPRVALIGNAAHTLHPVAGQGLNLGLRDVAGLAELLEAGGDPGAPALLGTYEQRRRRDVWLTAAFTHSLVKTFSGTSRLLALGRGAGLLIVDALPPLKGLLARQSMGLAGRLPKLLQRFPR